MYMYNDGMEAVTSQMQEARQRFVSPFLQVLPVSHGSQPPLLIAVDLLGGLDEVC